MADPPDAASAAAVPRRNELTVFLCSAPFMVATSQWPAYFREDRDVGAGAYLLEQRSWLCEMRIDGVLHRKSEKKRHVRNHVLSQYELEDCDWCKPSLHNVEELQSRTTWLLTCKGALGWILTRYYMSQKCKGPHSDVDMK